MKNRYLIPLLFLFPLLVIGCTADSLEPSQVEAAEPILTQPPTVVVNDNTEKSEDIPDPPPKSCPVTQPPQGRFIPPAPYTEYPYAGHFWYGTENLWTAIPIDRTWRALPYHVEHGGYAQKVVFWRYDYDWQEEPQPALTLSGRRLDADAPLIMITQATNGYTPRDQSFMLIGVDIPTLGCWDFTGQYGEDTLTFVIWVAP
jgi:hypothetical protein